MYTVLIIHVDDVNYLCRRDVNYSCRRDVQLFM